MEGETIETKSPKGFDFEYTQLLDDDHGSVPHISIYNGLLFIYSGWKLDKEVFLAGLKSIDKHYSKLSKEFGLMIETPENTINQLGYYYLQNGPMVKAIGAFKENVKRYPNSANVYDSLGEAYEINGQTGLAEANYKNAVDIASKKDNPNLSIFKENLKRVQNN